VPSSPSGTERNPRFFAGRICSIPLRTLLTPVSLESLSLWSFQSIQSTSFCSLYSSPTITRPPSLSHTVMVGPRSAPDIGGFLQCACLRSILLTFRIFRHVAGFYHGHFPKWFPCSLTNPSRPPKFLSPLQCALGPIFLFAFYITPP